MARSTKDGLNYFPMDVDIFTDRKIRMAMSRFGGDAIAFYLYILCETYRDKGYYLKADEDFQDIAAADLGVSVEKIGLMLGYFLNKSLLDGTLFKDVKVLSSHSIQKRYQEAVSSRGKKRGIEVEETLWLLSEDETQGYIQSTHFEGFSEKNADYSRKNGNKSRKNTIKESKGKESIIGAEQTGCSTLEDTVITLPLNDGSEHPVLTSQADEWARLYPAVDIHQQLRNMRGWLLSHPKNRKTAGGIARFINGWLSKEQDKSRNASRQSMYKELE